MFKILRKIWRGIKAIGREFKAIFRDIWKYGIKKDVTRSRKKLVFDTIFIGIWVGSVLMWPGHTLVEAIAIGFTGALISKPLMFKEGISADFLNPMIGIIGFTGAYWLWSKVRAATMILASFSIPRVTQDIYDKTEGYFEQLS